ncbi:WD repeat domain phosphoinositide-interacting protein, putative [Entamoeba invadens IP1]|uniref:WD repeat domain phosphoinositide-interacting protein, putative n=1 Tax=Entamoeba invadens IP1 TaxID=370355 RepID=L7FMG4_ENTIV|nr:WD repeat domain phosphoinositide-interacting protein, putative [Entamoeba invadens IP1]ELP86341.1 WD repeat domain phosphoinositide-interacting protein, putative [Entamoeba invadens IP1]|eukprot:XP_004185687.1 WD repeat domain phosphoinositide-interacting protein, putative [Entamoeba invadens IP1]
MIKAKILTITVNQEQTCFAIGTTCGFRVFGMENGWFRERFSRTLGGGVGIIELFHKSNMLSFVGGGTTPAYDTKKVIIWDDYQGKPFGVLEYPTEVRGIKIQKEYLFVAVDRKVYVYNFKDLHPLYQYTTGMNGKGIIGVSVFEKKRIVVPGQNEGCVKIVDLETQAEKEFQAHVHSLSALTCAPDGKTVVTASAQGTLIRVWDLETTRQIIEFRRGQGQADVFSMNFSPNSDLLVTTSNRGTVHIYGIGEQQECYSRPSRLSALMKDNGLYSKCECTMESGVLSVVFFYCTQIQFINVIGITQNGMFYKYILSKKEDKPLLTLEEKSPLDQVLR